LGFRFRLHQSDLPGTPDVVLSKIKTVVFVHGCFWHRHHGCKFAYHPKSRQVFWDKKFAENMRRDRHARGKLRRSGWKALVIWECELSDLHRLAKKIRAFVHFTPAPARPPD